MSKMSRTLISFLGLMGLRKNLMEGKRNSGMDLIKNNGIYSKGKEKIIGKPL